MYVHINSYLLLVIYLLHRYAKAAEDQGDTNDYITIHGEAIEQAERIVYLEGLTAAGGTYKKHTKEYWTHFTSICKNEQDIEKQRINKENHDKNIRDDDTTDFSIRIVMLSNAKAR